MVMDQPLWGQIAKSEIKLGKKNITTHLSSIYLERLMIYDKFDLAMVFETILN